MSIAENINNRYGNYGDFYNPVLKDILTILEDSGLLEHLDINSPARTSENGVEVYSNLSTGNAAAVEVLVDSISRAILKRLQTGFSQTVPVVNTSITSDGSSNIGFKSTTTEDIGLQTVNLSTTTNVHEAIYQLAQEINLIKNGIAGLGVIIPPVIPTQSVPANVK